MGLRVCVCAALVTDSIKMSVRHDVTLAHAGVTVAERSPDGLKGNYTRTHRHRPTVGDADLEATDCVNVQLNNRERSEKDQKDPFSAES